MKRRTFLTGAMALSVSACTMGRPSPEIAHYDLGAEVSSGSSAKLSGTIGLDEVSASGWLQTNAILYRLAYRDAAQLQAYSLSRWAESPAALVTRRLRNALTGPAERGLAMVADGVPTDHIVKVSLDTFEQWVRSATSSDAVVAARVLLLDGKSRSLRGQQQFRLEEACPSVDAEGAVRALRAAADKTIAAMVEWLAVASRRSA